MKIVINGAGIAGPTLAYWLRKSGHDVVLVEESPAPRRGGYVVDFWGMGYDIAERMGILPQVRDAGYAVREVRFVGRGGRKRGGFPVEAFQRITHGRFTSLRRSDLAAAIYGALDGGVRRVFGDSVAAIEESTGGVQVAFEHSPPIEADLVIGADGLHSRVRRLAFGAQERFEVSLGYHVAAFEARGYRPREELVYITHGLPGRQISRFSMRDDATLFLFVFRDEYLPGDGSPAHDPKARIASVFDGVGWEWPAIREALEHASDVYFDRVSQIRMDRWSKGRVALVGDAAAAVSLLAGEGSGLAMAEAYVLAGELAAACGDHARAFARYEERLAAFIRRKQAGAARFASSFAPRTAAGLAFRDFMSGLMRLPGVAEWLLGRDLRDDVDLPRYP